MYKGLDVVSHGGLCLCDGLISNDSGDLCCTEEKKDNYCEDGEGYSNSPLAPGIIAEVKKKYKGNKSASLIDNRRLAGFFAPPPHPRFFNGNTIFSE